jgi:hypothetical protein
MAIKISTALRNAILASGSVRSSLNGGFIRIYSGAVPSSADSALGSATLLCVISVNSTGTGITFATTASGGVLTKNLSETWSGVNVASGTASFYRHVAALDTGENSATQVRIQGTVGTAGADLNLTNTTLVNGAPQLIDFYSVAMPTL